MEQDRKGHISVLVFRCHEKSLEAMPSDDVLWKHGTQCYLEEWKGANEFNGLKEFQEGGESVIQSKSSDGQSVLASRTLFWRQRKWYLLVS